MRGPALHARPPPASSCAPRRSPRGRCCRPGRARSGSRRSCASGRPFQLGKDLGFGSVDGAERGSGGAGGVPALECVHDPPVALDRLFTPSRHAVADGAGGEDRKSTRLNSSHLVISYAVFSWYHRLVLSTLLPFTTLFRSHAVRAAPSSWVRISASAASTAPSAAVVAPAAPRRLNASTIRPWRSIDFSPHPGTRWPTARAAKIGRAHV